jgi:hypothetical protein
MGQKKKNKTNEQPAKENIAHYIMCINGVLQNIQQTPW